jgi:hypothetical protein
MTIAAAKGRGLFKVHETGKGLVAPQSLILGVKIEVSQNGQQPAQLQQTQTLLESGVPLYVEGEAVPVE